MVILPIKFELSFDLHLLRSVSFHTVSAYMFKQQLGLVHAQIDCGFLNCLSTLLDSPTSTQAIGKVIGMGNPHFSKSHSRGTNLLGQKSGIFLLLHNIMWPNMLAFTGAIAKVTDLVNTHLSRSHIELANLPRGRTELPPFYTNPHDQTSWGIQIPVRRSSTWANFTLAAHVSNCTLPHGYLSGIRPIGRPLQSIQYST